MTSPVRAPRPTPRRSPAAAPARPPRPDLRVVRDADRPRRSRSGMILATAGVVVFAALLASAVFHSMLVSGQAHLDEIEARTRTEQADLQREQLELADHQSPERIAREATRMGMVPAAQQSWVSPEGDAPLVVDTEVGGPGSTADTTDGTDGTDGTDDTDSTDTDGSGTGTVSSDTGTETASTGQGERTTP